MIYGCNQGVEVFVERGAQLFLVNPAAQVCAKVEAQPKGLKITTIQCSYGSSI